MSVSDPHELMRLAIVKAREGIVVGQAPFGCVVAINGKVVALAHNRVWADTDVTAHAEIIAIREACTATGGVLLEGAVVATSCEPCPMCMAALHWARVDTVFFGASISDARLAGFRELSIPAAEIIRKGGSPIKLVADVLSDECRSLFDEWRKSELSRAY